METSPFERLRTLAGVSRTEFASVADLSRQAVLNLEAGMYPEVPLRANRALATLAQRHGIDAGSILRAEYGFGTLNQAMDAWKQRKRAEVDARDWPPMRLSQAIARFDSPGSFCRRLCIPTSAIYHAMYGSGSTVPAVIHEALHDAGYQHTVEAG